MKLTSDNDANGNCNGKNVARLFTEQKLKEPVLFTVTRKEFDPKGQNAQLVCKPLNKDETLNINFQSKANEFFIFAKVFRREKKKKNENRLRRLQNDQISNDFSIDLPEVFDNHTRSTARNFSKICHQKA